METHCCALGTELDWGAYKKERKVRLSRLLDLEGAVGSVPLDRVPLAGGRAHPASHAALVLGTVIITKQSQEVPFIKHYATSSKSVCVC